MNLHEALQYPLGTRFVMRVGPHLLYTFTMHSLTSTGEKCLYEDSHRVNYIFKDDPLSQGFFGDHEFYLYDSPEGALIRL